MSRPSCGADGVPAGWPQATCTKHMRGASHTKPSRARRWKSNGPCLWWIKIVPSQLHNVCLDLFKWRRPHCISHNVLKAA